MSKNIRRPDRFGGLSVIQRCQAQRGIAAHVQDRAIHNPVAIVGRGKDRRRTDDVTRAVVQVQHTWGRQSVAICGLASTIDRDDGRGSAKTRGNRTIGATQLQRSCRHLEVGEADRPVTTTLRAAERLTPPLTSVRLRPAASSVIANGFEKTANELSEFITIVASPLILAVSETVW